MFVYTVYYGPYGAPNDKHQRFLKSIKLPYEAHETKKLDILMAIKHQVLPASYIRRNDYSGYTTHDQFLKKKKDLKCAYSP